MSGIQTGAAEVRKQPRQIAETLFLLYAECFLAEQAHSDYPGCAGEQPEKSTMRVEGLSRQAS